MSPVGANLSKGSIGIESPCKDGALIICKRLATTGAASLHRGVRSGCGDLVFASGSIDSLFDPVLLGKRKPLDLYSNA